MELGDRMKANRTLNFGSIPKDTLGTVKATFTAPDGKLRIIVAWDNGITNQWTETGFNTWLTKAT